MAKWSCWEPTIPSGFVLWWESIPCFGKLPVEGLYLNGGWGTGGFKATPGSGWVFAHTIAEDRPHPLNAGFSLERFAQGATIDERGAGPIPGAH